MGNKFERPRQFEDNPSEGNQEGQDLEEDLTEGLEAQENASGVEPWDRERLKIEQAEDGMKIFADIQKKGKGLQGIVIGEWDEAGELERYLHEDRNWVEFDDDSKLHRPLMYQRLPTLDKAILKFRDEGWYGGRIGLTYWQHPDRKNKPLDDYVKMTGSQYPGSPRQ